MCFKMVLKISQEAIKESTTESLFIQAVFLAQVVFLFIYNFIFDTSRCDRSEGVLSIGFYSEVACTIFGTFFLSSGHPCVVLSESIDTCLN